MTLLLIHRSDRLQFLRLHLFTRYYGFQTKVFSSVLLALKSEYGDGFLYELRAARLARPVLRQKRMMRERKLRTAAIDSSVSLFT